MGYANLCSGIGNSYRDVVIGKPSVSVIKADAIGEFGHSKLSYFIVDSDCDLFGSFGVSKVVGMSETVLAVRHLHKKVQLL